eukprot:2849446-Rhodomonas_salina.1
MTQRHYVLRYAARLGCYAPSVAWTPICAGKLASAKNAGRSIRSLSTALQIVPYAVPVRHYE